MSAPSSFARTAVIAAPLAIFALMFAMNQLPLDTQSNLLREGGLIETLSVIGYGICILLMFLLWGLRQTRARWYFPVMMALFAGRELDMDKIPFTEGLLKSRQYIGDTVPTGERIITSLILLAIIATVLTLIWRETRRFARGLRMRSPAAFAVLIGILFIGVYKTIDGLGRKLLGFGIEISQNLDRTAALIEEIGELGIPVMFGLAIIISSQKDGVS